MTEVIMPKMGDGMEEGTLLEWLKSEGDTVKSGEVIGTIQTDKATLELESPGTGTLAGIKINPGETVPVGHPIAAILKDGEQLPSEWASANGKAPETVTAAPVETPKAAANAAPPAAPQMGRIKASPLAKKIAAERGIDLSMVVGSGPGGRITEKDLPTSAIASKQATPATPVVGDTVVKLNKIRQITGQRTQHSKQTVPHFYVTVEVRIDRIQVLRDMFAEEESGKVSVNDFVVRACALALRDMPTVNSSWQDTTSVMQHGAVNIGMAVALEDGLTVPVIHHADQLTIREIGARAKELASKARDNRLPMSDLEGSTFSISNMGMLNVENFGAIINEPNAAIVAVSTAKKTLVLNEDDEAEVAWVMKMTGSFDHRVVDGAVGANFMNVLREYLENPTRLLS